MIKKIIYGLLLTVMMTMGTSAAANTGKGDAVNSFEVLASESGLGEFYHLNPFYFNVFFLESIVSGLQLNKYVSDAELRNVAYRLLDRINHSTNCKLIVRHYKDKKDLHLTFVIKKIKGDTLLIAYANYNVDKGMYIEGEESCPDCWAMAHYIIGDKLIYSKYALGKKREPDGENKTAAANYYMLDAKDDNDKEIEHLLLEDINDSEKKDKEWSYVILSQYYLSIGDMASAEKLLNEVIKLSGKIMSEKPKSNFGEIARIVKEEYLAMKMYHQSE